MSQMILQNRQGKNNVANSKKGFWWTERVRWENCRCPRMNLGSVLHASLGFDLGVGNAEEAT